MKSALLVASVLILVVTMGAAPTSGEGLLDRAFKVSLHGGKTSTIGPFSMIVDNTAEANEDRKIVFDNPICNAISKNKRVEMVTVGKEVVNDHEFRVVEKKIVIEPYVYGLDKKGWPVIQGAIIDEKKLKEVVINYESREDKTPFEEANVASGIFKTADGNLLTVDLRRVKEVKVLNDMNFKSPDSLDQTFRDDVVQVICKVSATK